MKNLGYIHAIAAAILFGVSTPFAKQLLSGINPWMLAGLLYLGSGLGLAIVTLLKKGTKEARLSARDCRGMSGAVFFGGILGPVLLMYGLARTSASTGSLLLNLEAVFTASVAWFLFREHFSRRIFLGMIFIVVGGIILAWSGDFRMSSLVGPVLIAGACLCWGLDNSFTREVSASDPFQIAMVKCLVAGTTNSLLALAAGSALPSFAMTARAVLVGFFGYGLSLAFFVFGLRYIGTARTGAYFSVAPFVGAGLSIILMGDPITARLLISVIFMGAGVWLHLTESHDHDHEHQDLLHEHQHVHDEHHQHEHYPEAPSGEPHNHEHRHINLRHAHPHFPDIHHRHSH